MITLDYSLTKDDFLFIQLYRASHDEQANKQRRREKYRIIGLSLLCGIVLFLDEEYRYYSYFMLGSGLLFFLVYPWWSAWFYKRMFKKQIEAQFKDQLPYFTKLVMEDEFIEVASPRGNTRFLISDIKSIIETKDHLVILFSEFMSIIIPKKEVPDLNLLQKQIEAYRDNYKIPVTQDFVWKWK